MFVADELRPVVHYTGVLDSRGLLAELERLRADGVTTNADLARLLKIPSSRVAEIFSGKRRVSVDEMKLIVETFGLDSSSVPSAETLEPILDALLPLVPTGRLTEQSRKALAEALSCGLELLYNSQASDTSEDALRVAAQAAVIRFRERARG